MSTNPSQLVSNRRMVDDLDVTSSRRSRSTTSVVGLVVVVLAGLVLGLLGTPGTAPAAPVAQSPSQSPTPAQSVAQEAPTQAVSTSRKQRLAKKRLAKKRAALRARAVARKRAAAARAEAATRWTNGTVRYHDGLPEAWKWSLRTAVAQWNASGADLTLVPVSDASRAQLEVGYGDIGGSSGLATVGRTSGAFVKLSEKYADVDPQDPYYQVEVMGVLTHELGHVLGLGHITTSCGLMSTMMDIVGCGIYDMAEPEEYRCAVLSPDAARLAVRAYGGSVAAAPAGRCTVGS